MVTLSEYLQQKEDCYYRFVNGITQHHAIVEKRQRIRANKPKAYETDPSYLDLTTQWEEVKEKLIETIREERRIEEASWC
jgi:phytoene dehydrogenase-like protein